MENKKKKINKKTKQKIKQIITASIIVLACVFMVASMFYGA